MDTSAIVTLLAGREYARELRAYLTDRTATHLGTSTIGFVETVRTLDLLGDFPTVMQDLDRDYTEILLTDEVRDAAAILPGRLRALDAVHVASAQVLGDALDVLISYDKRMVEAAQGAGLPIAAPGLR
ncbi:type II toxin-antitoxin system VapC family toxin [Streptomyces sp. NPDC003077]|uniref:type II toxin-antitoxin system VapC family toxin n=1 Tax=Streptomyces sp. NPDC003077 TaxID=3154443 RepID=UPI0033B93AC7